MKRFVLPVLALAATLIASAAVLEAEEPDATEAPGANVRITITVGDVEHGSRPTVRTYRLVTSDGGEPAHLLIGWRTPIPTHRDGGEMHYVYQNVGMTAHMDAEILAPESIRLSGELEISGARSGMEGIELPTGMPLIGTFQQAVVVLLREGQALRVAEVPDPEGGTMYVELAAEILDD